MRRILILLISCLPILSIAAETVIQGNIEGYNGKIIKAAIVKDYITNSRSYIADFEIKNNQYKLSFDIDETREIIIKLEDKESSIFSEVGAVYNINLSYSEENNRDRLFDKALDINFEYPKANELNQIIKTFNISYNDFIANNYHRFITAQAKDVVDKYIEEQKAIKLYRKNSYAESYVKYSLASLKNIINISEKKLYEEFLKDQDILYLQKEYMNFFKQLYQENFESISLRRSGAEILKAITLDKDLDKTLRVIKEQKGFENTELAELYLIFGLNDVYYRNIMSKKDNIQMLNIISKEGSTEKNKELAKNIIEKFTKYERGEIATDFELLNEKNELKKLTDFYGKPTYLGFWANWSIPSLKQLEVMNLLHEKYGEKINFISINLDENPETMKTFLSRNKYNWTFLHYGNDYEVRENYNARTVPTYFLIDENGKIIEANTLDPTEVEQKLHQLSKRP